MTREWGRYPLLAGQRFIIVILECKTDFLVLYFLWKMDVEEVLLLENLFPNEEGYPFGHQSFIELITDLQLTACSLET